MAEAVFVGGPLDGEVKSGYGGPGMDLLAFPVVMDSGRGLYGYQLAGHYGDTSPTHDGDGRVRYIFVRELPDDNYDWSGGRDG